MDPFVFEKITLPVVSKPFPDSIRSLWDVHDGITTAECDGPNPELDAVCEDHDSHFWPHKGGCPLCGSDAYVGFALVECSRTSCGNWHHREGM